LNCKLPIGLSIFFRDAGLGKRSVLKYYVYFSMDGADGGQTVDFAN
jgi:hypothetical protein